MVTSIKGNDTSTFGAGITANNINLTGNVLQVVQTLHTTSFTTTSGTYVDVPNFNVTITPSSASSKILVMVTALSGHSAAAAAVKLSLLRGSTEIAGLAESGAYLGGLSFINEVLFGGNFLDSPATTSPVTYKVQIAATTAGNVVYISSGTTTKSTITVMEIAG